MQTDSLLMALTIDPEKYPVIAVAGGGGKTSLIFRLCEELMATGRKVIITTTTHMAYEAERPFAEVGNEDKIRQDLEKYNYTVAATLDRDKGKIGSLPEEKLEELRGMADVLLIEADGAKRLPLKVPGEWEPVIPAFVDMVIGVVGMDAVGQPISEICHRPERVADFLDRKQTDLITTEDVVRISSSEYALKKAVGERSYRVFLNKTDIPGRQKMAENICRELAKSGIMAAWGSLQRGEYHR